MHKCTPTVTYTMHLIGTGCYITDADMAGDLDGRKSTSGFLFTFAGELFHGGLSYRSVSLCLLLRQNM